MPGVGGGRRRWLERGSTRESEGVMGTVSYFDYRGGYVTVCNGWNLKNSSLKRVNFTVCKSTLLFKNGKKTHVLNIVQNRLVICMLTKVSLRESVENEWQLLLSRCLSSQLLTQPMCHGPIWKRYVFNLQIEITFFFKRMWFYNNKQTWGEIANS